VIDQGMIHWLAMACRQAREEAGIPQMDIAAQIHRDPATIFRFEEGKRWPRNVDLIVQGYAECLGITSEKLWGEALRLRRRNEG
jgi:ribosome-binding protein aMBF1 (putative translation factor)